MSKHDEGHEDLDALIAASDPVPADEPTRLSLLQARHDLLEEIMSQPTSRARVSRRWLAPIGAAAAVAVLAAGAWFATDGDDPRRVPAQGFADTPGDTSSTEARPTKAPSEKDFLVMCEAGEGEGLEEPVTAEMLEAAGCEISYAEGAEGPEPERYQKPLRPMLITAKGWIPDRVDGYDITWVGPEGQEVRTTWILTAHPDDPWAYDKEGAVKRDEEVDLLGVRSRLGEYVRGEVRSFALTSQIYRDGTSVYFTSDTMDAESLLEVAESAEWVSVDEFDRVVKPAVGE